MVAFMTVFTSLSFSLGLLLSFSSTARAWHACDAGGLCPDQNTCCPNVDDPTASFCLPSKNERGGSCCVEPHNTGCGDDYSCDNDEDGTPICQKTNDDNEDAPEHLPRYRACSLPWDALTQIHGLVIDSTTPDGPVAAYMSTGSSLNHVHDHIKTLFVVVHGSGRNVEDYFCSAHAALPNPDTTLLIAPWLMAPGDESDSFVFPNEPLRWAEYGPVHDDVPFFHTWRYGADATNAPVSSYAVVDRILEIATASLPRLREIIVTGHSAGGQFAQRWALLSNSHVWKTHPVRVVVANPRSFCFLSAERLINGTWQIPNEEDCPVYNEWEWGLGPGDWLSTPYKDQAIDDVGGVDEIIRRYPSRDIVYLAGEQDIIPNGDCQDQLQGAFRRVRSENFMASLERIYHRPVHRRYVASGIPHDHTLLYQSPEGQQALFGDSEADMKGSWQREEITETKVQ
jgi:hypothetical protein